MISGSVAIEAWARGKLFETKVPNSLSMLTMGQGRGEISKVCLGH